MRGFILKRARRSHQQGLATIQIKQLFKIIKFFTKFNSFLN